MIDYYNFSFIPQILKIFKVKNVILVGLDDKNLLNEILTYDANFTAINLEKNYNIETIIGSPLNAINNLSNYDAIFIDDDSNWFTIFNELNIIKNTNEIFPLVFLCNNRFPNKRRDSYSNPDSIPEKFRQTFTNKFPIYYNNEKIMISDGYYHACNENTPKNGVLTAIEDFLSENCHVGMLNINDIVILYLRLPINLKRIEIVLQDIQESNTNHINIFDKLNENKLLVNYINRYDIENDDLTELEVELLKKNSIIRNYENKIRINDNELMYKDSHINNIESKLSLKDSEIENVESKLINRENKIKTLENQIVILNHELEKEKRHLKNKIIKYNAQISSSKNEISSLKQNFSEKEKIYAKSETEFKENISNLYSSINQKNIEINTLKDKIITITNENELLNKELFKKDDVISKKDLELEIYKGQIDELNNTVQQKENHLKLKDNKLGNIEKRINFLEHYYINELSEIDTKKYAINSFKDEISNNLLEINYFKNNSLIKKILSPIGYLYLIFNSKPQEISTNIKLYNLLKDSECFNIGFYLNNNKDLLDSKWCKYFSPELHYVCNGFEENRSFNKKYSNNNSKMELLNYLLKFDK